MKPRLPPVLKLRPQEQRVLDALCNDWCDVATLADEMSKQLGHAARTSPIVIVSKLRKKLVSHGYEIETMPIGDGIGGRKRPVRYRVVKAQARAA